MSSLFATTATPPPTKTPRGNPNLHLTPRCGARTRSGCPCQAPAVRGKPRCRMHGGRSTGPRTAEGVASLRAARTIHGNAGAEPRAEKRYRPTLLRRSRVNAAAMDYQAHLPPVFVARLYDDAPELLPPPRPTGGIIAAADRMRRRAVAAALAPWKHAIGAARAAHLAARLAKPHAPVRARPSRDAGASKPHAPIRRPADPAATTRANRPPEAPATTSPTDATPGRPTPPRLAPQSPPATAAPRPHTTSNGAAPNNAGAPKPHAPIPGPAEPAATTRANRPARSTSNDLAHGRHARPPDTAPPGTAKPAPPRRTNTPCNLARCRPQQRRRIKTPCTYSRPRRARRHHPRQPPGAGTSNDPAHGRHARPPDTAPPGTAKPARNCRTKTPYNLDRCRPRQYQRSKTPCTYSRPHRARHPARPAQPCRAPAVEAPATAQAPGFRRVRPPHGLRLTCCAAASSARRVRRRPPSAVASAQARSRHSRAIRKQPPSLDGPPQPPDTHAKVAVITGAATLGSSARPRYAASISAWTTPSSRACNAASASSARALPSYATWPFTST